MLKFHKVLLLVVILTFSAGTALAEDAPGSLDWYRDPANKAALQAKLQECKGKSEAARKADEECNNARLAEIHGEKYQKVKEPEFGFTRKK